MKKLSKKQYVVAGFLAILALFPLGTDMAVNMIGSVQFPTQEEWSQERRELRRIREKCASEPTGSGSEVCDPIAVRARMRLNSRMHKAASEEQETEKVKAANPADLDRFEQGLIRRAQHAGYCADQLKIIVPGLYELCVRVLRETGTAR